MTTTTTTTTTFMTTNEASQSSTTEITTTGRRERTPKHMFVLVLFSIGCMTLTAWKNYRQYIVEQHLLTTNAAGRVDRDNSHHSSRIYSIKSHPSTTNNKDKKNSNIRGNGSIEQNRNPILRDTNITDQSIVTTESPRLEDDYILTQNHEVHWESIVINNGTWTDNGANFHVSPEQEHVFDRLRQGSGGATTCSWNRNESHVSQDCVSLLAPVVQDVRLWYFMGDSTMARPWQWCLLPKIENNSQVLKRAKGTAVKDYLGITEEETLEELKPPNLNMGEGPIERDIPYKPGCSTCENRLIKFRHQSANRNHDNDEREDDSSFAYAEFLTMEYARDVEYASTATATTQESIARYMHRRRHQKDLPAIPKNQTACVISSGMHDIKIPNMTSEVYIRNHVAMKRLLKGAGCDIWIKLELNARGVESPDITNTNRIYEWNEGIKRTMEPDEYQINLFERTLNARHADRLHMDPDTFYCPLAEFFIQIMGVDHEFVSKPHSEHVHRRAESDDF